MDRAIDVLNAAGKVFCDHAGRALVQSSILIAMLLVLDLLLRRRVRAVVRYALWMLVFVKLLLPPSLALPTGIGYYRPEHTAAVREVIQPVRATPPEAVRLPSVPVPTRTADAVDVPDMAVRPAVVMSSTTAPVSVRPAIMWQGWVFLAWCAGVTALYLCLIRRFRYVRKLVRRSVPAAGPLQEVLAQCAARLELRRCPELRLSDRTPGPVVCGLLSPVVLMPITLADNISDDRLRTVLVHELAHIKRGDLWANFIQTLLLVAYFYHPLLWLVNAIVRRLREQAVDEMVLVALDADAAGYGTTLIDLAEMTFHRPILGLRLIGIAESKKALEGRIRHMMTRPKPQSARVGLWGLAAIIAAGAMLLPMAQGQIDISRNTEGVSPDGRQFEGELVFNETLPVGLAAGAAEHPKQVVIESIRFETAYGNAWEVVARLRWLPVRDTTWRITAELLDDRGRTLRHPLDRALVFTGIASSDVPTTTCCVDLPMAPMQFEKRRHASRFRLRLEPWSAPSHGEGRTMEIGVVESGGGSPVPGAVLVVDSYHETSAPGPYRALYTTDGRGRCEVRLGAGMLVSSLTIRVQKDGFASMTKVWSNRGPSSASRGVLVNLPQRHVFELISATAIGGTVHDVDGAPIEAAEVGISAHLEESSGRCSITRTVRSDADGRWHFEGIPQGIERVSLWLKHPQFGGDSAYSRQIEDSTLVEARALQRTDTLERGVRLSGTVLDERGKPVTGAAVMLMRRGIAKFHAITGPRGEFDLVVCKFERHSFDDTPVVLVEGPGYAPVYEPVTIAPDADPLEFRLERGKTVTCRVVDNEGRPLAGAWTVAHPLLSYERYDVRLERTDDQGEFEIPNTPDDDIRLTVGKRGFVTKRDYVVTPAQGKATVSLERAVTVRGAVTDAVTGRLIPAFEVATVRSRGNWNHTGDSRVFADGVYELSLEEAWSTAVQLRVSAAGYEPGMSEDLSTGAEQRVLDFQLTRSASFDAATAGQPLPREDPRGVRRIAGVVRDKRGTPVAGATVSPVGLMATDVVTDSRGAFSFETSPTSGMGVFPRREGHWLLVRHKDRNLAAAVKLGETVDSLDITLTDGMVFSGRVADIDGKAVPDARFSLTFCPSRMSYGSAEPTRIGPDGRFEIRAVPRGYRYSVRAHADGYGEPSVEIEKDRVVGERLELEPLVLRVAKLPVSGVVVDERGRPVANVRVASYGDGQPHRETYTDTRGTFTLEGLCRGAVALQANAGDTRRMQGQARTLGGSADSRIVLRKY